MATDSSRGINRRTAIDLTPSLLARMEYHVDKRGPEECWPWKRSTRQGYGAVKHHKQVLSAHRVAFVIANGEPPEGMIVTHQCDNRLCCNPAHLRAGSPEDNNREIHERRRATILRGEMTFNAVLNDELLAEIWRLRKEGFGHVRIGRQMGINANTVKGVIYLKHWQHKAPEWAIAALDPST